MPDSLLHRAPLPAHARRVLVIRLGALGDVVRTLPAVALLRARRPGLAIDWLVEERARGPLEGFRAVDRIVELPRRALVADVRAGALGRAGARLRAVVRALRAARYDAAIDFHGIAKSALLARLSGAPLRYGYARPHAREGAWLLATHRARLARGELSRHARNRALVDFAAPAAPTAEGEDGEGGSARDERAALAHAFAVDARARAALAHALAGGGAVAPARPPVLLHPGTSAGAAHKRWTPDGFAALAARLARAGERVLVARGPGEDALAQAIVDAAGGAAALAPATATFADLAALASLASVVVAPDSAAIHVASLVGTPVVQLVGPTNPVENAPGEGAPWRRVRAARPLPCAPCRRGCAAAACMRAVRAADVERAVRELVGPRRAACGATVEAAVEVSRATEGAAAARATGGAEATARAEGRARDGARARA
ncbi:MAG: glycosyltransferase family 9 protein [Myxococcota bacterium]